MSEGPRHTFRYPVDGAIEPGQEVELGPEDTHHLVRVVRRGVGDRVELVDWEGLRFPALVSAVGERARLRVDGPGARPAPSVDVSLWLGISRWETVETVVRMGTELGLRSITLLRTERIARMPKADELARRVARLGRLAEVAARQSGVRSPPAIAGPVAFQEALSALGRDGAVLLDPRAEGTLAEALAPGGPHRLLIGPEAGFGVRELEAARTAGVRLARLAGLGLLRVDTAAVAAVASAALASVGPGSALDSTGATPR